MALKSPFYNVKGEEIGEIDLPEEIFGLKPNIHLLWQYVRVHLDRKRRKTASTKTRGEVKGGGRKPWIQKGLGRARHGSIRSPIWRGGGVTFGPKPKVSKLKMPKKAKRLATKCALSDRAKEGRILVIENFSFSDGKTKEAKKLLSEMKILDKKVLICPGIMEQNVKRAFRNLNRVSLKLGKDLNAYDVLASEFILFTKEGLNQYIEEQGKK